MYEFLNLEFLRGAVDRVCWYLCVLDLIKDKKVWSVIRKMKNKNVLRSF